MNLYAETRTIFRDERQRVCDGVLERRQPVGVLLMLVRLKGVRGALVAHEGAEVAILVAVVWSGEHRYDERIRTVLLAEPMLLVAYKRGLLVTLAFTPQ